MLEPQTPKIVWICIKREKVQLFIALLYIEICSLVFSLNSTQARSQDQFWRGTGPQKSGLFEPEPLNPPTKTWPNLWLKWTLWQIWSGASHPLATGLILPFRDSNVPQLMLLVS